jgi:uncharacterized membrane protein YfcA
MTYYRITLLLLFVALATPNVLADTNGIPSDELQSWFSSGAIWIGILAVAAGCADGFLHIGRLKYEYPQQTLRSRGRRALTTDACFAFVVACIVVLAYAWLRPPGQESVSLIAATLNVLLTLWGTSLVLLGTIVFSIATALIARRPSSTSRAAFFG